MFNILSELGSGHRKKTQMSNNALKETKALVNSCLNEMSEITGRALGRWRNMSQASIDEYEKIAYMLAHKYSRCFESYEQEEMFEELKAAGFEGIVQGLTNFNPTKNTKLSTFVYSRAKFAIQKAFAAIKKTKSRGVVSINRAIDDGEDEAEFGDVITCFTPEASVEEIVAKKIRHEALFKALQTLSPRDQHIVMMCAEYNTNQVAKKTNIPIAQVNLLLKQVRDNIGQIGLY